MSICDAQVQICNPEFVQRFPVEPSVFSVVFVAAVVSFARLLATMGACSWRHQGYYYVHFTIDAKIFLKISRPRLGVVSGQ